MSGRGDWRRGWDEDNRLFSGDAARPLPAPNRPRGGPPRQPGRQPPPGYRPPPQQRPPQRPQQRPPQRRPQGHPDDGYDHQPPPGGRRGGPPGQPPRRPPRRKRRIGRIFGILFAVLVLLLAGIWFYVDMSLNRTQALDDYPGRPAQGAGTNWLIVGTDSREGLTRKQQRELSTGDVEGAGAGKRTDTMMMLHIPDNDTKPTLVSLLRDSYVDIPGMGQEKLNAAYNGGDATLLAKTVEQASGMRIDHYAEIGFGGFASVVDTVGGVNICVKDRMRDPKAGINLRPGCQDLDGPDALGFVRSRYASARGDYDRVNNQRQFLGSLMGEVASPGTILNPFKSVPLIIQAPELITVDEGDHLHHLVGLAWAMKGAGDGSLVTTTVPTGGGVTTDSGGAAIAWDEEGAQQLFKALNNDRPVPKSVLFD